MSFGKFSRFAAIAAAALLLVGCRNGPDPAAIEKMRAKPMSEWLLNDPAMIAREKPERLDRDGVALAILAGHAVNQKTVPVIGIGLDAYGERKPASVWIQGPSPLSFSSPEEQGAHSGWSVMILKPGTYRFKMLSQTYGNGLASVGPSPLGEMMAKAVEDKVDVKAGDVVYIGSFVGSFGLGIVNKDKPNVGIFDETDKARVYVAERLAPYASRLKTRLMPCNLCVLRDRMTKLAGE